VRLSFRQVLNIKHTIWWEPDRIRISKTRFTVRTGADAKDQHAYFSLIKRSSRFKQPILEIQMKEPNSNKYRMTPYKYKSIELTWEQAEMITQFLKEGPFIRQPTDLSEKGEKV
jgi:hypothetical protein